MRRGIALVLTMVMLIATMLPLQVFAQEDKGLEEAIKIVKTKLTIPEKLSEFNYNISSEGDQKIWYLGWHGKNGSEGNLSVRVDDKGRILNYDYYKPHEYSSQRKLPKISRNDAKQIAEDFINKMDPALMAKVSLRESRFNFSLDSDYSFNYVRIENGIPYYANSVTVTVSRDSGEVRSYYCNWRNDISFPAAAKVLNPAEAQKAYKEKLGLELAYTYAYEGDNIRVYAAYMPKYNNNYYIDALTGEKIGLEPMYYGNTYTATDAKAKMDIAAGGKGEVVNLTPDELKAVEKVSKLKTKTEVEKLARNFKTLELTDEFVLSYANLSKDWPNKDEFVWNLSFMKEQKDKKEITRSVSVRINALTGEINSFYFGLPYRGEEQAKYDEKAAKTAVEAFLKEFKGEKFAQSFYDERFNMDYTIVKGSNIPNEYSIRYTRKVNGVPFTNNFLMARYDAVNGKISGFEMNWFNMEFPSLDKVTPIEKIYETMFKEIGLELQYAVQYSDNARSILPVPGNKKPENVRLVYAIKPGKNIMFDANSGVLLDYNGQPYKEMKSAEYSDIAGHYAESQIKVLAEFGITPEGKEFKPNESILQKDFLLMLSKTLNGYVVYPDAISYKENEELYKSLIREGIIKEREKAPDLAITREEAAKFIIRAMKYDKVAEIPGIFNCTFKDAKDITPEMLGHVTIAQGLGIISGANGYFNPLNEMTRAQAAVVIYNYLQK